MESENQAELAGGTELHLQHGRTIMLAGLLQILGFALLLAAIALAVFELTSTLLR